MEGTEKHTVLDYPVTFKVETTMVPMLNKEITMIVLGDKVLALTHPLDYKTLVQGLEELAQAFKEEHLEDNV